MHLLAVDGRRHGFERCAASLAGALESEPAPPGRLLGPGPTSRSNSCSWWRGRWSRRTFGRSRSCARDSSAGAVLVPVLVLFRDPKYTSVPVGRSTRRSGDVSRRTEQEPTRISVRLLEGHAVVLRRAHREVREAVLARPASRRPEVRRDGSGSVASGGIVVSPRTSTSTARSRSSSALRHARLRLLAGEVHLDERRDRGAAAAERESSECTARRAPRRGAPCATGGGR